MPNMSKEIGDDVMKVLSVKIDEDLLVDEWLKVEKKELAKMKGNCFALLVAKMLHECRKEYVATVKKNIWIDIDYETR